MARNRSVIRPQSQVVTRPGVIGKGEKGPKRQAAGRRCACGAKLSIYTQGEWCNMCSSKHWDDKGHAEGCTDCPDGEKFARNHVAKGLCTTHYAHRRKSGTLPDGKLKGARELAFALGLKISAVDTRTDQERSDEAKLEQTGSAPPLAEDRIGKLTIDPIPSHNDQAEAAWQRAREAPMPSITIRDTPEPTVEILGTLEEHVRHEDMETEVMRRMVGELLRLDGLLSKSRIVNYLADRFTVADQ